MRLLIVEDERAIAEVMMLNLKRVGYECEYAQDGGSNGGETKL